MKCWRRNRLPRGSGETLSCGTGACASVAAAVKNGFCSENEEIRVILRGGELTVTYTDQTVWMTGNAELTFEGSAEI